MQNLSFIKVLTWYSLVGKSFGCVDIDTERKKYFNIDQYLGIHIIYQVVPTLQLD